MSEEISVIKPGALKKRYDGNLPEYITPEEANAMINAAINENNIREEMLFKVLWMTGCRISEAVDIKVNDIIREGVVLRGKRKPRSREDIENSVPIGEKRKRIVYIPAELRNNLYSYNHEMKKVREDRLFPFTTVRGFQLVKKYAEKAGIQRKIYPHMFRHGYAVNFLNNSGTIPALKEILGHSLIEDTMIYLRITSEDIARQINRVVF